MVQVELSEVNWGRGMASAGRETAKREREPKRLQRLKRGGLNSVRAQASRRVRERAPE